MNCQSCRRCLLDVALGAAEPRGLVAHLASCPECREALDRERAHVSRMDFELRSALEVEPTPALLAGARRRAAAQKASSVTRPWLQWLVPAGVSLAVFTGVILVGRPSAPPAPPPPPALVQPIPAPPRESPPRDVASARPAPERRPRASTTDRLARRPSPSSEPEVLLAPDERAAFDRFVRYMQQGQFDQNSLLVAGLEPEEVTNIAIAAVEVKPLAIEPIPRSDR